MLNEVLLLLVLLLVLPINSQLCTIPPRPAEQLVDDPGFEQGDLHWALSGPNNQVLEEPTYPAHSGTHMKYVYLFLSNQIANPMEVL